MYFNTQLFKNKNHFNRYDYIHDMRYGIVREVIECVPEADDPKIYVLAAISSNSKFLGANDCNRSNSAAGLTYESAYRAAISECVERYCSAFQSNIIYGTFNTLNTEYDVLSPSKFPLYTEQQYSEVDFPYKKFDNDAYIGWTEIREISTNKGYLVPASMVYLPYTIDSQEDLIYHCVSTGLSCSTSLKEAILKGIYEVMERDMFSITWFNKISFPLFDINSDLEIKKLYDEVYKIQNCNYNLICSQNELGITTVIGALEDSKGGVIVAAATRASQKEAVKKTLLELSQGRIAWKKEFIEGVEIDCLDDFSNIETLEEHVMLYTKKEMKSKAEFLYSNSERVPIFHKEFTSIDKELEFILEKLKSQGYDVYYKDLTTNDVAELGYKVVKVLIPGFVDLTVRHKYPLIASDRLYSIPVLLGLRNTAISVDELNKDPHPFP